MTHNKAPLYLTDEAIAEIEKDKFGHAHIADAVFVSLINTKPPFIVGILGGWGTGKSSILAMVQSKLDNEGISTAFIDAWRYSSADNLRREFLVRVVGNIAPKEIDDLKVALYSSQQETAPPSKRRSIFNQKISLRSIGVMIAALASIFLRFILASAIFLGFLLIIASIKFNLEADPGDVFDLVIVLDQFLELAFIPFLLAIADILRPYLVHDPIYLTRERIDSEELFAEHFDKAVKSATESIFSKKKRLVIFIDNLDRLKPNKMVEALEALKTFLGNKRCIFVVACDYEVVRSAIEDSEMVSNKPPPKASSASSLMQKLGEDYLDKFFQQTFRLPPYLNVDLSDFAEEQLSSTALAIELTNLGTDIRNLRSMIIPSDVASPRKIKRLLNEFIATFEIARRRETSENGQLRQDALTGDPEFLGKISTIRAEYPDFYNMLVDNPALLATIQQDFVGNDSKAVRTKLASIYQDPKLASLVGYLMKTQTVLVDDIEPYLWLSQDSLALGLQQGIYQRLRVGLSNGDHSSIRDLIASIEEGASRRLATLVASRLVEQRLSGHDQINGTIVLSKLINLVDDDIRPEIAQVAANLIPACPLDSLETEDLLNVLHWSERAQEKELINSIFQRLDNPQFRENTFEKMVADCDVLESIGLHKRLLRWLQNQLSADKIGDPGIVEFGDWIVKNVSEESFESKIVFLLLARVIPRFIVSRFTRTISNIPPIDLSLGEASMFESALVKFGKNSEELDSDEYWLALRSLAETGIPHLYQMSSIQLHLYLDTLPHNLADGFLHSFSSGLNHNPNGILEFDEISLDKELGLFLALRSMCGEEVSSASVAALSQLFLQIHGNEIFLNHICEFIPKFRDGSRLDEFIPLVEATAEMLRAHLNSVDLGSKLANLVVDSDDLLSSDVRNAIAIDVFRLANSSDPGQISISKKYFSILGKLQTFNEAFRSLENELLTLVRVENAQVLEERVAVLNILQDQGVLSIGQVSTRIAKEFPYSNDKDQLLVGIKAIRKISDELNIDEKLHLFGSLLPHLGINVIFKQLLNLISDWYEHSSADIQELYAELVISKIENYPHAATSELPRIWPLLSIERTEQITSQIFRIDSDLEYNRLRAAASTNAIKGLDIQERRETVEAIWQSLSSAVVQAEKFMEVAVPWLDPQDVRDIRQSAIERIGTKLTPNEIEIDLRLLSSTKRRDLRDVMQIVQVFEDLFSRSEESANIASRNVLDCLRGLTVRSEHKHKLAAAMGEASRKFGGETEKFIKVQAGELALYGYKPGVWAYRRHWRK